MKKNVTIKKGDYIELYKWRTARKRCIECFGLYPIQNEIMGIVKGLWDYITKPGITIRVKKVTDISVFCRILVAYSDDFDIFIPKCVIKTVRTENNN